MTFGRGVALEDTYVKRWERMLHEQLAPGGLQVQVINAAVGNYHAAQQAAYLRQRAKTKQRGRHAVLD